jgi:hypothetical protein
MAATTQVTNFSDLYTDLENRVRVATGVTTTENQAKRYINIALQDMHLGFGEKFWWAHRSDILRTRNDYTTGTVAVTMGSTTVTGTSTTWDTNDEFSVKNIQAGGKIKLGSRAETYEIASVASNTSLTLTDAYIGDTDSGLGYTYFEDEYALASDFLRPLDFGLFSTELNIPIIGRRDFNLYFVRNNTVGKPSIATLIELGPSGSTALRPRVRLWKPPNATYHIPYDYVTNNLAVSASGTLATALAADTDEPIVPLQYRHALVFHALYHWYRDKKDDTRSQTAKVEYSETMGRIAGDTQIGSDRPRFEPMVRRRGRVWRRSLGRYVIGTAWDELR